MNFEKISPEYWAAWIAILGFGFSTSVWVYRRLTDRITRLIAELVKRDLETDERVDTIIRGLIARGVLEAKRKNMVTMDSSPQEQLVLTPAVRQAFQPIAQMLHNLYTSFPVITEERFAIEVERRHGDWLIKHICGPMELTSFACLKFAFLVATEGMVGIDSGIGSH